MTTDRDFGREAQALAEERLASLWGDEPEESDFCGCNTCLVREILEAAWPAVDAYCDEAGAPPLPKTIVSCETPGHI